MRGTVGQRCASKCLPGAWLSAETERRKGSDRLRRCVSLCPYEVLPSLEFRPRAPQIFECLQAPSPQSTTSAPAVRDVQHSSGICALLQGTNNSIFMFGLGLSGCASDLKCVEHRGPDPAGKASSRKIQAAGGGSLALAVVSGELRGCREAADEERDGILILHTRLHGQANMRWLLRCFADLKISHLLSSKVPR